MRKPNKDDLETIEWLARIRWPHGIKCPSCQSGDISELVKTRGIWQCRSCRLQFGVFNGTRFEGTRLSPFKLSAAIVHYYIGSIENYESYATEILPRKGNKIKLSETKYRWLGPIGVQKFAKAFKSFSTAQRLHLKLRAIPFSHDMKLETFIKALLK